ncbi:MAG: Trm112 family protein [Corynebacterium sp.]|nr:Trm112 family protein [Corynebacterium sp.]
MSVDPKLVEILVDPVDQGALTYHEAEQLLVNEQAGRAYRIEDDIPIMLADKAIAWPLEDTTGGEAQ